MNRNRLNNNEILRAFILLTFSLFVIGCGAGRTMVMAPAETSGAFGGSFDSAIQKAATEVAEYAKRFR